MERPKSREDLPYPPLPRCRAQQSRDLLRVCLVLSAACSRWQTIGDEGLLKRAGRLTSHAPEALVGRSGPGTTWRALIITVFKRYGQKVKESAVT